MKAEEIIEKAIEYFFTPNRNGELREYGVSIPDVEEIEKAQLALEAEGFLCKRRIIGKLHFLSVRKQN